MNILILSPGKTHSAELRDAIQEYETRLRSVLPIEWLFLSPGTKESEGNDILKRLKPEDAVILFDEQGKDCSSTEFTELLDGELIAGTKRLVLIIGGAFGVSDEVKTRAQRAIRLSAMVFPHMLVRLIVIEQLYRAWSIRTGGKYHHA